MPTTDVHETTRPRGAMREAPQKPNGNTDDDVPPPTAPKPETNEPWKAIINLRKPIVTHEDTRKMTLTLREPTVADMMRYGIPVSMELNADGGARPSINAQLMAPMLAALAYVAPSSIEMLDPRDFMAAAWAIAPFFVPDMRNLQS